MGINEVRLKALEDKVSALEGELFMLKKACGKSINDVEDGPEWFIVALNLAKNLFFVAAGIIVGFLWAKAM